jgi:hypothetical protein
MTVGQVIENLQQTSPHLAHALLRLCVELEHEIGEDPRGSVRTVEWRGREIAHGHRSFNFAADDSEEVDIGEWVGWWRWGYWPGDRSVRDAALCGPGGLKSPRIGDRGALA